MPKKTYLKKTRKTYTEEFRSKAVTMLVAEGYPDSQGAVERVSKMLGVSDTSLSTWIKGQTGMGATGRDMSQDILPQVTVDFEKVIVRELDSIFEAMKTKRATASYRDLAIAAGILSDKLFRLRDIPTITRQEIHIFDDRARLQAIQELLDKGKARAAIVIPPTAGDTDSDT